MSDEQVTQAEQAEPTAPIESEKPAYYKVEGLISDKESDFLCELAKEVPEGGEIVNVGNWHGKSVACLYAGQPKAHITALDIDNSRLTEKLEGVDYIEADSGEIAATWEKEIDLIFIDGSHSYTGVTRDCVLANHLKQNGKIVFHDYGAFLHEVTYAVDDWWRLNYPTFRKVAACEYIIVYQRVGV